MLLTHDRRLPSSLNRSFVIKGHQVSSSMWDFPFWYRVDTLARFWYYADLHGPPEPLKEYGTLLLGERSGRVYVMRTRESYVEAKKDLDRLVGSYYPIRETSEGMRLYVHYLNIRQSVLPFLLQEDSGI